MKHHVLITGAGGAIGRVACTHLLAAGHQVHSFDIGPGPEGVPHTFGSLSDAWRLNEAAQGCDTMIHLAATPDMADMVTDLVPNNIIGTWNALETARKLNMRRVVLASTIRVVSGLHKQGRDPITIADGYSTHDAYALSKVMVEEMGRHAHQRHGMSIVCARFAWFLRTPRSAIEFSDMRERDPATGDRWYLSHDDCGRFLVAAVEHPDVTFAPVFVVSHNNGNHATDCVESGKAVGWTPQDSWPQGTPFAEANC